MQVFLEYNECFWHYMKYISDVDFKCKPLRKLKLLLFCYCFVNLVY